MKRFIILISFLFLSGINLLFANLQECNLKHLWLSDYSSLFFWLKEAPKSDEDLWRYIWFWWRKFTGDIKVKVFKFLFWTGCYSIYKDAEIICANFENIINNSKNIGELVNRLQFLYTHLDKNTKGRKLIYSLYKDILNYSGSSQNFQKIIQNFYNNLLKIRQYYQYRSIKITDDAIYIPYTYLIPLNISYNRSLQNLSSYYTDIWYVWLVMWMIIVLWFLYSVFTKNRLLFSFTIASIWGYILWWLVWSWILWYGIWLIIWTILSFVLTLYFFIYDSKGIIRIIYIWTVWVIIVFFFWQLFLNFIRISSQGWQWPFAWYKNNFWKITKVDNYLTVYQDFKFPYKRKDVFDLQFPHYNKFIKAANSRSNWENIFLAWTYARYFIKDQKWLVYDQMLVNLWKRMSDWNTCKTYLRLAKAKWFKYIAIDPNIWTVTDFENKWNKTLFDRFYWNINLDTWKLDQRGVLTFLWKMFEDWYVKYFYSNNLAAKYWFVLTDEEIKSILKKVNPNISNLNQDDIAILRGSLVAIRYPWVAEYVTKKFFNWSSTGLSNFLIQIVLYRIKNLDFVSDIVDYYGKNNNVDINKVKSLVALYIKGDRLNFTKGIRYLNNDEKLILINALNIVLNLQKEKDYSMLLQLVMDSIRSPYGKNNNVDINKIKSLVALYIKGDKINFAKGIRYLNNDEKLILVTVLNIILSLQKEKDYSTLWQLMINSVRSPSQIFVLEFK